MMKIFGIITPRRLGSVTLVVAAIYAVLGIVTGIVLGGGWPFQILLAAAPLALLGAVLRTREAPGAWTRAMVGLVLAGLWLVLLIFSATPAGLTAGDVAGMVLAFGVPALLGLAGFLTELPHLRDRRRTAH